MAIFALISIITSFLLTLYIMPRWIAKMKERDLVSVDVHKPNKEKVAELGGLIVVTGFLTGILFHVGLNVFIQNETYFAYEIFASIISILIATIIGFADDILGWKIGIRQFQKMLLSFAIAIPIMVINAGVSVMNIPLIGPVEFGLAYPLLFIPLAIMFTSNAFNMLAGYNGLESGMGIIILATLSLLAYSTGAIWVAVMGMCMVASIFVLLIYNFYPAKIFGGDTLTYATGTLIGIMAILGNIEKFAIILFMPYILEFILKARGLMQKESFAVPHSDGSLTNRYKKWYGLEHIAISLLIKIKGKAYEAEVTTVILAGQYILAVLTLAYFFLI